MPSEIAARNHCPASAGSLGSTGAATSWKTPIMRAVVVASFLALLCPAVAMAQSQPAPAAAPPPAAAAPAPKRGADIARNAYVERAQRNAEKRFDRMDADHDGVLTLKEREAYRIAHARHRTAKQNCKEEPTHAG